MVAMRNASFEAVLEECGLTAKWVAKGLQKGREEGLQKGLQKGLREGLEKGLQKGWEKGREEGLENAVKRLQKYGMEPKQIAEALALPLGTVFRYLKAE
jgi:flagellar biosynthesis/type III secretory pathway protein FliH